MKNPFFPQFFFIHEHLARFLTTVRGVGVRLAVGHIAQGHYAEARELINRALVVSENVLGANHSQFGNTLNSLGALLLMQEQTDSL